MEPLTHMSKLLHEKVVVPAPNPYRISMGETFMATYAYIYFVPREYRDLRCEWTSGLEMFDEIENFLKGDH